MTLERRMVAGIDDIQAVTFQCSSCTTRTTVPADSLREVPRQCTSCNAVWWRGDEIATHVSTSGPAATAFIQAIRTLTTMMREKKDAFRIFLEFDEPKAG
jgi:DNA replicative helicase MCM subunit Mcm2 (Cdc46/Mcm family)